jgi:hypothetical protein
MDTPIPRLPVDVPEEEEVEHIRLGARSEGTQAQVQLSVRAFAHLRSERGGKTQKGQLHPHTGRCCNPQHRRTCTRGHSSMGLSAAERSSRSNTFSS